jgi:hypothetical protein
MVAEKTGKEYKEMRHCMNIFSFTSAMGSSPTEQLPVASVTLPNVMSKVTTVWSCSPMRGRRWQTKFFTSPMMPTGGPAGCFSKA